MDWHLFPMSHVSWSTWDKELLQVLSAQSHNFSFCRYKKQRWNTYHQLQILLGSKSKGKKEATGSYPETMQLKERRPTVTRVFFCSAQAISRTSGCHCAKGFLGILQTVRLKGGLCKRRKLTVDEESKFNINMSNHLHGCGIHFSARRGVWRETKRPKHRAIVSIWMQHL